MNDPLAPPAVGIHVGLVNQVLEAFLRSFVNYDQVDWYNVLPSTHFVKNNDEASATQVTLYFGNRGFYLRTMWVIDVRTKNSWSKPYAHWMKVITRFAVENL